MKPIKISAIMAMASCSMACDSFLEVDLAPQLIETENVLVNEQSAEAAVNGVFTHMRTGGGWITNGGATIYGGLVADEFELAASHPLYDAFYQNALLPNNSTVSSSFWNPAYQTLYRCNVLIDGLASNSALVTQTKNRLLGELLVVRALQYTCLAGFFGDVPLVLTPDYTINATLEQTKYEDVLTQAAIDLSEARGLLAGEVPASSTKIRPTYWAATALLARINLYLEKYADAARYASEIIEGGPFRLHQELSGIFLIDQPETIWEIASPFAFGNTAEGGAFLPSSPSRLPSVLLTETMMNAFEPGDLRQVHWTGTSMARPDPAYYAEKYIYRQSGDTYEYLVVLRLAELYLIRAEARLEEGDEAAARADLNVLRERADIPLLDEGVTGGSLISAMRKERQCELFAEWGHRWFDIRRWGIMDSVLTAVKPNWKKEWAFFPLPEEQLRYNYKLTQNPGY